MGYSGIRTIYNDLRNEHGKPEQTFEILDVAHIYVAFTHDGDGLPIAPDVSIPQRPNPIDLGEVGRPERITGFRSTRGAIKGELGSGLCRTVGADRFDFAARQRFREYPGNVVQRLRENCAALLCLKSRVSELQGFAGQLSWPSVVRHLQRNCEFQCGTHRALAPPFPKIRSRFGPAPRARLESHVSSAKRSRSEYPGRLARTAGQTHRV